jgi:hypothetical protein
MAKLTVTRKAPTSDHARVGTTHPQYKVVTCRRFLQEAGDCPTLKDLAVSAKTIEVELLWVASEEPGRHISPLRIHGIVRTVQCF